MKAKSEGSDITTVDAIHREYQLATDADKTFIDHAVRCGELLIEQKKAVGHGKFGQWVKDHLKFSHDTANDYMKLAGKPKNERARFY